MALLRIRKTHFNIPHLFISVGLFLYRYINFLSSFIINIPPNTTVKLTIDFYLRIFDKTDIIYIYNLLYSNCDFTRIL